MPSQKFTYSQAHVFSPPSLPSKKTGRCAVSRKESLSRECKEHLSDYYAGPLESSYVEEDFKKDLLTTNDDDMYWALNEAEWDECSLAESEVSFEMIEGEAPSGTLRSFRDVLLSGLSEDSGASGAGNLSHSPTRCVWGMPAAAPSPQPRASSTGDKSSSSLSDAGLFEWENAKETGARAKLRDASRKTLEKERKKEKRR